MDSHIERAGAARAPGSYLLDGEVGPQSPEAYDYRLVRESLFTDEGQRLFLKVRDRLRDAVTRSGALRMREAISGFRGERWQVMACVDRMVELGELVELEHGAFDALARVFVAPA